MLALPKRLTLLAAILAGVMGSRATPAFAQPLSDSVSEANVESPLGRYPSFIDTPSLFGTVSLLGDTRAAVTPPFPSRLTLEIDLPSSAYLSFDLALIVVQRVERARVRFTVDILEEASAPERIFEEVLELRDTNRWHPRVVDLRKWSGRRVTVRLASSAKQTMGGVLWADRVQTVWADAVIDSRPWRSLLDATQAGWGQFEAWGRARADSLGLAEDQQSSFTQFLVGLLVGGILTLYVRALYERFGGSSGGAEPFANMFLVLTLTTMFVIYVVQSSLALSLGLIGALSIVRFRTAVKSPGDLVYAFLCVAIGLALGANRLLLCTAAVFVISIFIFFTSRDRDTTKARQWLLTVSGAPGHFFTEEGVVALDALNLFGHDATIQRLDHDKDLVQLRAFVTVRDSEASSVLAKMRERLPGLNVSYVDVDELL